MIEVGTNLGFVIIFMAGLVGGLTLAGLAIWKS